ncbi:MAG: ParB/RepB/Spo0J family partition protein [Anaerolineae bacterium]
MPSEQRITYLDPREIISSGRKVRADEGDLEGLAETIRQHGLLQPLGVTRDPAGYRLVYGHRRRDAAIIAGLVRVPCILLDDLSEEEAVIPQVLENLQRLELNDMDKSQAFGLLLDRLTHQGMAQSEALDSMARTLGLSVRQIQRYLRLRSLSTEVQLLIAQDELGVTQAQHLVDITPLSRQQQVADLVVEESLSAAELGRLCDALRHNANVDPRVALAALRRGERVPVVEMRASDALPQHNSSAGGEQADTPWADVTADSAGREDESESGDDEMGGHALEPNTRDGNRVRKIHSLDSFMDELQRLTSCVQEGDLQRLSGQDPASAVKLKLAARQFKFLAEAFAALAALD